MAQESPDDEEIQRIRQETQELQRQRQKAEEGRQRAEERRQRAEEGRQRAEERLRKTTLPELLDACHIHLQSSLTVQTNTRLATQGDPANADHKVRPENLVEWTDFPTSQAAIWEDLQQSDFMRERHFFSRNTLKDNGKPIRERKMSSEIDLYIFEAWTVEYHITSIIKKLYKCPSLRDKFCLKGSVAFEKDAKPLTPPYADQFYVYNISGNREEAEDRAAALIIQYKAPHKLQLGCIITGLVEMDLQEVIRRRSPQNLFHRLVAAVISETFSYMVNAGLEYGYVCTGEAFIFLRVPDDPRTVHYFLSVPKSDVGETTGLSDASGTNTLHLTAMGQVLAFTLQALKKPPRSQQWRANAVGQLKLWDEVYEELLHQIPKDGTPSSEY